VTARETFEALPRWFTELETYISTPIVKILVGNKVDKEYSRQVSTSEGEAYARKMGSLFVEASAKTAVGVEETFKEVVETILDTAEVWEGAKVQRTDGGRGGMPGGVQVVGQQESQSSPGCAC
jgi:Ras-related protein Rab-18